MKKLFIGVMMVALAIALAQPATANDNTKWIKATGGGYIPSDCGGEAIASFGFFAKSEEITPGYANPAKGELQYSDLGCDNECRNIHAKIIFIHASSDTQVEFTGITDEGYYINVTVIDNPSGQDEFQIVFFNDNGGSPIYLCTNSGTLLRGDITVEVKTKD